MTTKPRGCTCGAADVWSCVCSPITPRVGHLNPFNGKCIHGKDRARMTNGRMMSRDCPVCYPELAHTCPYGEELYNDMSLCTCSQEQTRECANDI